MRMIVSVFLVAAMASPAFAQEGSLMERVRLLEQNNSAITQQLNGISAMQTRLQADVADVKADVKDVRDKLDALAKAVAPGSTFRAAVSDPWGPGVSASFSQTTQAKSSSVPIAMPMMSGYGSMSMSSMGAGSCASGQCGSSAGGLFGRGGLFARRR